MLLGLAPGTKEDTASCRGVLRDLKSRGLADPILGVTDGAPGLVRAFEEAFPRSLRQRCLAHKMPNLQSKVPEEARQELKGAALAACQGRLRCPLSKRQYPSATACFLEDLDALHRAA